MKAANTTIYIFKTSVGLYVASSEFKVADKNNYDLYLENPNSTRDTSKMLKVYEIIEFYR